MHLRACRTFCSKDSQQFLAKIKFFNDRIGARSQKIKLIAVSHSLEKLVSVRYPGKRVEQPLQGLLGMPGSRIVDGYMQCKVIWINAELVQFIGANQQVQR